MATLDDLWQADPFGTVMLLGIALIVLTLVLFAVTMPDREQSSTVTADEPAARHDHEDAA